MSTYVIYHSSDNDGRASGAIVRQFMPVDKYIPYNYNKVPDLSYVAKGDYLFMLDCTLFAPTEDGGRRPMFLEMMEMVHNGVNLVWIDHHADILAQYDEWCQDAHREYTDFQIFRGFRKDGLAACELTWQFMAKWLSPHYEGRIPAVVEFLGSYDTWRHNMDRDVLAFHYGMEQSTLWPNDPKWNDLLKYTWSDEAEEILQQGRIVYKYQMNQARRVLVTSGNLVNYRGNHFIVANGNLYSSLDFLETRDKVFNKHGILADGCVAYYRCKDGGWKYSIRSFSPEFHIIDIAKEYGGGGHNGAGGWFSDEIVQEFHDNIITTDLS